jgi:hypothetical protein
MPKFESPVQLPQFTDSTWAAKKAKHVAKYGYRITVPAFDDIFHTSIVSPPSKSELDLYKAKKKDDLGKKRFEEIRRYQAKKREAYLRMIASPSPEWAQNVGSALNFLDDLNDSLGTLAFLAKFTARLVPRAIGKILMGPAGWALTAAEIVGFVGNLTYMPLSALQGKRALNDMTSRNPLTKKAAVSRARKLRKTMPTKGQIIEALQTTDGMFGYGISIGPLMGFAQDIAFGAYRVATGKKVEVKHAPMTYPTWMKALSPGVFALQAILPGNPVIDDDTYKRAVMTAYAMSQVMRPYVLDWNPLDQVDGLENVIVQARPVIQPSTLMLLEEEGIDPKSVTGFPQIGKREATFEELWDGSAEKTTNAFHGYAKRNKNTYEGWMTAQFVSDIGHNMIALAEGDDAVIMDYDPVEKACHNMLYAGYVMFPTPTEAKTKAFVNWIQTDTIYALSLKPVQFRTQSYLRTGLTWVPEAEL